MSDKFANTTPGLSSPAASVFAITANDSADLAQFTRALNVATSGAVHLETVEGDEATVFIAAGIAFPVRAKRIFATGTTATGLVGLA